MGIVTHFSNSQNFIKLNNKIPEYARDYKKEYLFIIGINKQLKYFAEHINEAPTGLFENYRVDRIKYFIKRFLKGQERGKLKDISNFALKKYDYSYIEDLYLDINYDFEENETGCGNKSGFREFYEFLCKFYNKIKIEYFISDYYYEEGNIFTM